MVPAQANRVRIFFDLESKAAGFRSKFQSTLLVRGSIAVPDKVRWEGEGGRDQT